MSPSRNTEGTTGRKRKHKSEENSTEASKRTKSSRHSRREVREKRAAEAPPPDAARDATLPTDLGRTAESRFKTRLDDGGAEQQKRRAQRSLEKPQRRQKREECAPAMSSRASMLFEQDERLQGPSSNQTASSNWTLSQSCAGRFQDHDPAFVQNDAGEEFLVTTTTREVQLLSTETSLPVSSFPAPPGTLVSCMSVDGDLVYIAFTDGTIWEWDWTQETDRRHMLKADGNVRALAVASQDETDAPSLLYYVAEKGRTSTVMADRQVLYSTTHRLRSIQLLAHGEYIIMCSPTALVLGAKKHNTDTAQEYIWLEIPLASRSTCMDARIISGQPGAKKSPNARPGLQIALGHYDGKILLHNDVSDLFRRHQDISMPTPRVLHWHREAVSSVKFSRDGNYLISGGKETVLVLWQLGTSKRQYLPHLTSEIQRIVVNAIGDRYAVQMGDNSIMVLNTSELKPLANFAGLQMLCNAAGEERFYAPAATLHPTKPSQLLLSVPATQPDGDYDMTARPFLQTFDINNSRHITRQALTRNNVTDFNLGPERTPIVPPDVRHLAVSRDGTWLATVDEWTPPSSDIDTFSSPEMDAERMNRKEVYLKFWHWDDAQALWTLTTRIDSPHACGSGDGSTAGGVFALASDPTTNGFATVGMDMHVRLWKPRTRMRHGVAVKDDADVDLAEWVCRRTCALENGDEPEDSATGLDTMQKRSTACLAYAADGSMLAVAQSPDTGSAMSTVHFVDSATGHVITKTGLAAADITSVGFIDRYFIAVSQPATYVWDLVTDRMIHKYKTQTNDEAQPLRPTLLSVNEGDSTFALVTHSDETSSEVRVYDPSRKRCIHERDFELGIEAILAGKGTRGYTLLFVDATTRTLSFGGATHAGVLTDDIEAQMPSPPASNPPFGDPPEPLAAQDEAHIVDVLSSTQAAERLDRDVAGGASEEDDRPVVRPEQLADVFDVGAVIMPPVKDMFQAVVGLFGRKPLSRPQLDIVA